MNKRFAVLAISLCLTVSSWGLAQSSDPGKTGNAHIADCIRKLGSSSFAQRESARQELEAIGLPALEALRRARKASDVETARRIADLMRHFEERLLTQQILGAKEIHLKLTDATLDQALAELAKLSGYVIQFQGDRIAFANKTFSLDTGKTSFWQALDQFCDQAGLLEKIEPISLPSPQHFGGRGRFNRIVMNNMNMPQASPGPIILTHRGKEKLLTSYAGSVKSQLRVGRDAKTKDIILDFIISCEPRLLNGCLVSRPVIEKAIDQDLRKLSVLEEKKVEPNPGNDGPAQQGFPIMTLNGALVLQRHAQISIKNGEQAASQLKELTGKLTVQLELANETVVRIDKILQATGQSAAGANGGTLKVNAVRKMGDDIEVQVSMENLTPNPLGANVMINGGNVVIRGNVVIQNMVIGPGGVRLNGASNNKDLPDLLDAKGQKYQIANVTSDGLHITNGASSRSATIIYRPNPGQTGPSELVLFGMRTNTIAVPFRFQNVPLP